ncbi:MAG TPA: antitoxin [Lachnospiraceae bacterium]|nr:antitoxin [Lachnospiraceae bacterium]HBI61228.1 antitoxin [Lachnospiraceae bacterium]
MCQVAINIPNEVLFDTKMSQEEANQFARCAVALGYYTQNGVSIGYCAQIAGMAEEEFIKYLGRNHVSVFHFDNKEEFLEELKNA